MTRRVFNNELSVLQTERKFESSPRTFNDVVFASFDMKKIGNRYQMHQTNYIRILEGLLDDCILEDFGPMRHKMACTSHNSTDICASVNML